VTRQEVKAQYKRVDFKPRERKREKTKKEEGGKVSRNTVFYPNRLEEMRVVRLTRELLKPGGKRESNFPHRIKQKFLQ